MNKPARSRRGTSRRTIEIMVTFRHPFVLTALETAQPAGTYRLVTDEQEIPGLSFVAFRRSAAMLHLPVLPATGATHQGRQHRSRGMNRRRGGGRPALAECRSYFPEISLVRG
jgi:hypothetical protein